MIVKCFLKNGSSLLLFRYTALDFFEIANDLKVILSCSQDFKNTDFVFECTTEDLAVKRSVIDEIHRINPECIIGTTSSALKIEDVFLLLCRLLEMIK